jgi:hypothetical protein
MASQEADRAKNQAAVGNAPNEVRLGDTTTVYLLVVIGPSIF